jgi:hypothetical protein
LKSHVENEVELFEMLRFMDFWWLHIRWIDCSIKS